MDRFKKLFKRGDGSGTRSSFAPWPGSGGTAGRRADRDARKKPLFTGVQRFGMAKWSTYFADPFHSMLNLPWWKFIILFVVTYMTVFCTFALIYWAFPPTCIVNIDGNFSHALWMSSRTASTIGYNSIQPLPDCPGVNLIVIVQTITSNLVDFIMLGLVFARFSAPFKRATSIRFSSRAVVNRHPSGHWAISFRVANIRKHQLLQPSIRVLTTALDSITPSNYTFQILEVDGLGVQETNLALGLPANVVHVIRPSSPLWSLSVAEMEARMMELLVFVDGVDAMTSKQMQARKSYCTFDLALNEQFLDMHLEMRGGKIGLDFSQFDTTVSAVSELDAYSSDSRLAALSMPELQQQRSNLRHQTFKRLTEQALGPSSTAAAAAAGGSGGARAAAAAAAAGGVNGALPLRTAPVAAGATGSSSGAAAAAGVELTSAPRSPSVRSPTAREPRELRNPFAKPEQQQLQQQQHPGAPL